MNAFCEVDKEVYNVCPKKIDSRNPRFIKFDDRVEVNIERCFIYLVY